MGRTSLKVLGGIGLALGLVYVGCTVASNMNYADGVRVGTINKFSRKGFLFKTHEGQLALKGMLVSSSKGGTSSGWGFSINSDREDLIEKINKYAKEGTEVTITYEQKLLRLPWKSDTDYFVVDIQAVGEKK